ncbi:unnamed protein product [Dovyalis caffra]|uniref:Uncharacterized protein n=1 Tax=Dovyalis caffra TaxID=77055 RepID=A0AAV1STB5_9ROSI|nr:unnamed protein product [Dovyalis caffra]
MIHRAKPSLSQRLCQYVVISGEAWVCGCGCGGLVAMRVLSWWVTVGWVMVDEREDWVVMKRVVGSYGGDAFWFGVIGNRAGEGGEDDVEIGGVGGGFGRGGWLGMVSMIVEKEWCGSAVEDREVSNEAPTNGGERDDC